MQSIRQGATPTAVLAYCEAGHTNGEAAARFGIHERTVRKWKARSAGVSDRTNLRQLATTRAIPANDVARIEPAVISQPEITIHIPDDLVARDGQLWKCPICRELMPPLPGTTGAEWNARGCYLHQVAPELPTIVDEAPTIVDDPAPALEVAPECAQALQEPPASVERPAPAPIVVWTRQARPGEFWGISGATRLISWGQDHAPAVQLGLGIVLVWLLVTIGR